MQDFCKIFFISLEFLVIFISICIYGFFGDYLDNYLKGVQFNQEMLKYLSIVPYSIFIWIWNKGSSFLQRDTQNSKILVEWDKYHCLKKCYQVGLFYAILSVIVSTISVLTYTHSAIHVISFFASLIIISIVAISFHFASGDMQDIFSKYN